MTVYLTTEHLLFFGGAACGAPVIVRDLGLVESALARPQASVFGDDAYPDVWTKAVALFQSLARNHPFVDGNKRVALAGTYAFLRLNGERLALSNDDAVSLTLAVCTGTLDDIEKIAEALRVESAD